jgi:dTDP-4-amino-4,6-dideoxygalactose transaminase
MNWKVPLFEMYWDEQDINAVTDVIKRGSYWSTGPEIKKLEENIAGYIGKKYSLSFNSGTSALHNLLQSYGITKGDEVIVPSFTFIATANTVALTCAKPVFAEIEDQSYGLDAQDVLEKITDKTKAIIPVHYGGAPCRDTIELQKIAEDNNLLLIEDAAESLGAKINDEMVGSFGDAAMFSFCQNKVITAGEGGIVVTDEKKIFERLKLLRSHGRFEDKKEYFSTTDELDYIQVGYNTRMSSMSAALAISQFKKIDKIIKMRREKAEYYTKQLSKIDGIKLPVDTKSMHHIYQIYTIQLENKKSRDGLKNHLEKSGIMTKVYFEPIHLKTFYRKEFGCQTGDLPITEEIAGKVLSLPIYPTLNNKEIDYICDRIKEVF